jgi:ABC-type amino acid transport substrate-binding protein
MTDAPSFPRRPLLAAAAGALAGLGTAEAQDLRGELLQPGTITIGTTGTAPPFTMTDARGQLAGYDIELMTRIARELGLQTRFVQLEWAGLLPGLAARRFDVVASGVARTPERLASADFRLLSPYIVNGVAITRRADDTRINGWGDVCGMRMGGVRGAAQPRIALSALPQGCVTETREYPGWTEMLLDLRNRRIDFIAGDFLGPNYLTLQQNQGVRVLKDIRSVLTQSIAVAPGRPALAAAIDGLIARWRGDGTLDEMITRWFGDRLDWSLAQG